MFYFFRYPYSGYRPVKYVVNPVRCVEAFLCAGCLVLAIIIVLTLVYVPLSFKVVITVVAAAFTAITIIDIISNSYQNPIYWNTWTLIAITGAILFFLCVGVLLATYTIAILIILAILINAVTAIIFLLDAFLILNALRKKQVEVEPVCEPCRIWAEKSTQQSDSQLCFCDEDYEVEIPEVSTIHAHYEIKHTTSTARGIMEAVEDERIIERTELPPKRRSSISYGGTFAVGTDTAPLPSPEPKSYCPCDRKKTKSAAHGSPSQTLTRTTSVNIRRGSNGRMYLTDGTSLSEVVLEDGDIAYKDPNGILYTKDGVPIISAQTPSTVRMTRETTQQNIRLQSLTIRNNELYTPEGKKVQKVYTGPDGAWRCEDGSPLTKVATSAGGSIYENRDGVLYSNKGEPIGYNARYEEETSRWGVEETGGVVSRMYSSKELLTTMEPRPLSEPSSQTRRCKMYLSDGTPLTETKTSSDELVYEGPDGELFRRDGTPIYSPGHKRSFSCGQEITHKKIICRSSSPPIKRSKSAERTIRADSCSSSRTVAISTRMVPKSQKPQSAPATSDTKEAPTRSVRSAETPGSVCHYQQKPEVVYHQFSQQPCRCGNVHYQQVSTVRGTVCSSKCPFFVGPKETAPTSVPHGPTSVPHCPIPPTTPPSPQKIICTPQAPCGKKDCSCTKEKTNLQPSIVEPVDKPPLQTISECDGETDSHSSISEDQPGSSSISSSQPTSSDPVSENAKSAENVYAAPKKSVGNDSVQTSETRIIRASDLQRINRNLPGSADHFRK